jgi:hypothetical protein
MPLRESHRERERERGREGERERGKLLLLRLLTCKHSNALKLL